MLIELYEFLLRAKLAEYRRSLADPAGFQRQRLREILDGAAGTVFAREYGLTPQMSPQEFRARVPVCTYADLAPYIERLKNGEAGVLTAAPVELFSVTSGSSAQPKFIPLTAGFTRQHHLAHSVWIFNMLRDHPGSIGRTFSLISPAVEGRTAGGIAYGSSSGKQFLDQNIPVRAMHAAPYEVFLIRDCLSRHHAALVYALARDLRTVNSVNPSTLVLLGQLIRERAEELLDDLARGALNHAPHLTAPERAQAQRRLRARPAAARRLREILRVEGALLPRHVWPRMKSINTWQGGSAGFYLPKVRELWGDAPQRCLGLRATEGIFSIPRIDGTSSGEAAVCAHYMEFSPGEDAPQAHGPLLLAHELETGGRYRLVATTAGGLYRYDMGDIVEVTGWAGKVPLIAFLHRAGGVLSLTGEKVCEDQVVNAAADAERAAACPLSGFSVTIDLAAPQPRYVLAVEAVRGAEVADAALAALGREFDRALSALNIEYAAKRESLRLTDPAVWLLPAGTYREYRTRMVQSGRPDGQIKPPHLLRPGAEANRFFADAPVLRRVER